MKMGILFLMGLSLATSAHATLMLEITGKITSFTEDWISIQQGRTTYTIDRRKLSEDENKKVGSSNESISLAVDPYAIIQAQVAQK
jgi:hypothetical protein